MSKLPASCTIKFDGVQNESFILDAQGTTDELTKLTELSMAIKFEYDSKCQIVPACEITITLPQTNYHNDN